MSPAVIDLILGGVLVAFALKGLFTGLVRTVVSLGAVFVAWFAAFSQPQLLAPVVGLVLSPHEAAFGLVVRVATGIAAFALVQLAGYLLGSLVAKAGLSALDKLAGLFLGAATGVLVGCLPVALVFAIPALTRIGPVQAAFHQSAFLKLYTPLVRPFVGAAAATKAASPRPR